MRRSKLVATAGALTVTAFAGTVAIGAAFGLAGRAEPRSPVGRLGDPSKVAVASAHAHARAVTVTAPGLGPHADD